MAAFLGWKLTSHGIQKVAATWLSALTVSPVYFVASFCVFYIVWGEKGLSEEFRWSAKSKSETNSIAKIQCSFSKSSLGILSKEILTWMEKTKSTVERSDSGVLFWNAFLQFLKA